MRNDINKREMILKCAKKCFAEKGFKEATIRDIAREAKISPAAIYTYFKNKQDLFDALGIPEYADYQPNNEKKKKEILHAALMLFGEKGYDGVTMDDIAASIRTSKATIYQYFSGKEDLFSQILKESSFNLYVTNLANENDAADFRSAIMDIGRRYLSIGDSSERAAIFKTVVRDSANFPELGTVYYEQGLNPAYNHIIEYVNDLCVKNGLPLKNYRKLRALVTTYIGSLQAYLLMQNIMKGVPLDVDRETYLETTTDVFINYLIRDGYLPEA